MRFLLWLIVALPLLAQQPSVVLVNGFQSECPANSNSAATFGQMEQLLSSEGWPVLYFDNCAVSTPQGRPSIEELGQAFGKFLEASGETAVDVVAHSMGGLIVRSYLSGKLPAGGFSPPPRPRIRKAVFLSTPHAGALAIAGFLLNTDTNVQSRQLLQGSEFLWELATWNQGTDDIREVDVLAVVADGGSSLPVANSHDGAVPVTSSAFTFGPDRVRVLPYCHQNDLPSFLCRGPGVAYVNSPDHLGYRLVASFLRDTPEWRTIGHDLNQSEALAKFGGAMVSVRNAQNGDAGISRLAVSSGNLAGDLLYNQEHHFFADLLPAGVYHSPVNSSPVTAVFSTTVQNGRYAPVLWKPGPMITSVGAGVPLKTLARAPGMIVSVFGSDLDAATATVNGLTAPVLFTSARQINMVIPEGLRGLVSLRVENAKGVAETTILLEAAVPVVFSQDGTGTGATLAFHADGSLASSDHPIRTGEVISVYLTGLGTPAVTPSVTINDTSAALVRIVKVVEQPGLDRIDIQLPPLVTAGFSSLVVHAGERSSNPTEIEVAP